MLIYIFIDLGKLLYEVVIFIYTLIYEFLEEKEKKKV